MHDPIAAGRSAAARAVAVEVAASGLVALGFLALDGRHALAAAIGGAAMAAGNALSIALAFGGGIQRAPVAFGRLLLGVMGKWMVVLAVFALGVATTAAAAAGRPGRRHAGLPAGTDPDRRPRRSKRTRLNA